MHFFQSFVFARKNTCIFDMHLLGGSTKHVFLTCTSSPLGKGSKSSMFLEDMHVLGLCKMQKHWTTQGTCIFLDSTCIFTTWKNTQKSSIFLGKCVFLSGNMHVSLFVSMVFASFQSNTCTFSRKHAFSGSSMHFYASNMHFLHLGKALTN